MTDAQILHANGDHSQCGDECNIGSCFNDALNTALVVVEGRVQNLGRITEGPFIVHALPVGTGPLNGGKRYWHAWVELKAPSNGGWLVLDWSAGNIGRAIPRAAYYKAGEIRESMIWRFETDMARRMIDQYGHAGPWVPDDVRDLTECDKEWWMT